MVHGGEPPVHVQLGLLDVDVVVREIVRNVHRHVGRHEFGAAFSSHEPVYGLVQHTEIEIEADGLYEARLFRPEQVPRPAHLEILESHSEPCTELGVVLQHLQPALGFLIHRVRDQQVAVGAPVRPTDAAAQLVELRQPEVIGAVDEHGIGVGYIESGLDDHRRDQHVHFALYEAAHDCLEVALAHLPVRHFHPPAGCEVAHPLRHRFDGFDAVVDEVDLAAAIELARNPLLDQRRVPRLDESEHRGAVERRCLNERHVAQPGQREVQCARNGSCRQRQHVGLGAQLLETLLVPDAETMFLIDDDESQIAENDIGAEQPVRADDDVDLLLGQLGQYGALLLRGLETAEGDDVDGKVGKALAEGAAMLLGENGRRHEDGHLTTRLHRLESRAHGDFGLAVAHIADEQPVHWTRGFHVAFHLGRSLTLIGGILEQER